MKTKYNIEHYREFTSASSLFPSSTLQFRNDGVDLKAQLSVPVDGFNINNDTLDQYTNILFNTKTCPQYTGLILHPSQMNDLNVVENRVNERVPKIKEFKTKFINDQRDFLLEKIRKTTTKTIQFKDDNLLIFYPKQQFSSNNLLTNKRQKGT
jgi:hypothetical protein